MRRMLAKKSRGEVTWEKGSNSSVFETDNSSFRIWVHIRVLDGYLPTSLTEKESRRRKCRCLHKLMNTARTSKASSFLPIQAN